MDKRRPAAALVEGRVVSEVTEVSETQEQALFSDKGQIRRRDRSALSLRAAATSDKGVKDPIKQ